MKDYLNYVYFHKRAFYLACIASGIEEAHRDGFTVEFAYQNDNHLQPIVIVTPVQGTIALRVSSLLLTTIR